MATQIFDQQSCIRIMYGDRSLYVQKKNIITVDTLQGDTVRIDIGEGALRHVYIRLQDVNEVLSQQQHFLPDEPALLAQRATGNETITGEESTIDDEPAAHQPIVFTPLPSGITFRNVDELCDYIKAMLDTWPVPSNGNGMVGFATATNQEAEMAQLSGITQVLGDIRTLLSNNAMQQQPSRIDESQPYTVYNGFAVPGTEPGEAKWAIQKLIRNKDNDTIATEWADGNNLSDNVWNNRFGLAYQPLA